MGFNVEICSPKAADRMAKSTNADGTALLGVLCLLWPIAIYLKILENNDKKDFLVNMQSFNTFVFFKDIYSKVEPYLYF